MSEALITEDSVIQSITQTNSEVKEATISVDTLLDQILEIQNSISNLSARFKVHNENINKFLINNSIEDKFSETFVRSFSDLNRSNIMFLKKVKKSKYYSGFKTAAKDLEARMRDFQELYQDIKLRYKPDKELLDLLNAAERTYTNQ